MSSYELHFGDSLELMRNMEAGTVDLIVTDPPYPVIKGGHPDDPRRPSGILSKNDGKIFAHNDCNAKEYLPEFYRVLRDDAHCYIFTNVVNLRYLLNLADDLGFQLHNLIAWKKNNCVVNRWYMKKLEYICFFRKGKAFKVNDSSVSNCLEYDNPRNKQHECEKPVLLMETLVCQSSQQGETVMDPFMGCCPTGVAAVKNNRRFIGCEIDPKYYDLSSKRMESCFVHGIE